MFGGELVFVKDEGGLVLQVRVLLQALDLLLCGFKQLLRENPVYTADNVPVTGNIVLSDELIYEVKRGELKAGNLRWTVPNARLTVASIL